jgi:hypothetical protein
MRHSMYLNSNSVRTNQFRHHMHMQLETRCFKIRLKPDSLERVREWARTLNETRRAEALATLRGESVIFEGAFLDSTPDGDFLIYIIKAESFAKSKEAVTMSSHDIDHYHQAFKKDTWQGGQPLEMLIDLDRISELTEHWRTTGL